MTIRLLRGTWTIHSNNGDECSCSTASEWSRSVVAQLLAALSGTASRSLCLREQTTVDTGDGGGQGRGKEKEGRGEERGERDRRTTAD